MDSQETLEVIKKESGVWFQTTPFRKKFNLIFTTRGFATSSELYNPTSQLLLMVLSKLSSILFQHIIYLYR